MLNATLSSNLAAIQPLDLPIPKIILLKLNALSGHLNLFHTMNSQMHGFPT
jgi:hypothetical protein